MSCGEEARHEPTPAQRRRAAERGDRPQSLQWTAALIVVAGGAICAAAAEPLQRRVAALAVTCWGSASPGPRTTAMLPEGAAPRLAELAQSLGGCCALLGLAAVVVAWLHAGCRWTPAAVRLDWSRLNPWAREASDGGPAATAVDVVLAVVQSVVLLAALVGALVWSRDDLLSLAAVDESRGLDEAIRVVGRCLLTIGVAWMAASALDIARQRWSFERRLRMTDEQRRDDLRAEQIDPYLADRLRARQQPLRR